jgi:hypothetical protein
MPAAPRARAAVPVTTGGGSFNRLRTSGAAIPATRAVTVKPTIALNRVMIPSSTATPTACTTTTRHSTERSIEPIIPR